MESILTPYPDLLKFNFYYLLKFLYKVKGREKKSEQS